MVCRDNYHLPELRCLSLHVIQHSLVHKDKERRILLHARKEEREFLLTVVHLFSTFQWHAMRPLPYFYLRDPKERQSPIIHPSFHELSFSTSGVSRSQGVVCSPSNVGSSEFSDKFREFYIGWTTDYNPRIPTQRPRDYRRRLSRGL